MDQNNQVMGATRAPGPKDNSPPPWASAICAGQKDSGETVGQECTCTVDLMNIVEDCSVAWVNVTVKDIKNDVIKVASVMGFSTNLVEAVSSDQVSDFEDFETEMGVKMPALRTVGLDVEVHDLFILVRRGLVLTIHDAKVIRFNRLLRYSRTFIRKKIEPDDKWNDKLTILLTRVIDENNTRNFESLRKIEEQGDKLNKSLLDPKTKRTELGEEIYKMKHALITYLDALWACLDVIHDLQYGDADMMSDDPRLLQIIGVLGQDITTQISLGEHMSEVLASGLEVLQSIYNNQLQVLNNRLAFLAAWLAVVGTAVLVPNTLGTIFGIPAISEQMDWKIMAICLMLSTVGAVWFTMYVIRKKGWIPHSLE